MRGVVFIAAFFISVFGCNCYGQNLFADTEASSETEKQAINYFNKVIGAQAEVNNGAAYTLYPSASKGTFYFQDKNFVTPAGLIYNGTLYSSLPVLYDVYHDQMVSLANSQLFVLIPENLSDVYLDGHHFIRTTVDDITGYYEEPYSGKSKILIRRTKLIEEHIIPPQTAETWYLDKSRLFIRSGNSYLALTNKNALLKAFGNKQKEVAQYLSDNKLDFSTNPESTAVKAATYFDQLNP